MTRQTSYFIGVDTGGTYTEAAGRKAAASAKALTTTGDLATGSSVSTNPLRLPLWIFFPAS